MTAARAPWPDLGPVTDPHGSLLLGRDVGCEVEFWAEEDGMLVAPRLNPAAEDSITAAENGGGAEQFVVANPGAARDAIGGRPLTVRLGYQTPNARLAAIAGTIAKACEVGLQVRRLEAADQDGHAGPRRAGEGQAFRQRDEIAQVAQFHARNLHSGDSSAGALSRA